MPKHIRDKALGTDDFHMKTRLSSQKLRMTEDPQLVDYLLLRFGTSDPGHAPRLVLNFASISKVVRKPVSTIRDLIKRGIVSKMKKLGDGTAMTVTNPPQQMMQSSAKPK